MGIVELIGMIIMGGFLSVISLVAIILIVGGFLIECQKDYSLDPKGCRNQIIVFSIFVLGIVCLAVGKSYGI